MDNPAMNNTTTGVALGAVTSPFWYQYLEAFSQLAALLLPIAGLTWLVIQIIAFVKKRKIPDGNG